MTRRLYSLLILAAVFCATFIPRMMLIGGPPATDEGIYAYNAWLIHLAPQPGGLLPDSGTLNIYPALLSWIFALDLNHFLALRFADAILAAFAGMMLYWVLANESGSQTAGAVIAVGWLLTMNDPVFIQYGFKNSIAFACLPMLTAILIGQNTGQRQSLPWFWCGALLATAALLREPFVSLALAGTVAVLVRGGPKGAAAYAAGGTITAALGMLCIISMRGGYEQLLQSYIDTGKMLSGIAYQQQALLETSPWTFAKNATGALLVSASMLIILACNAVSPRSVTQPSRILFWLALAITPLIEPMLKNGFPYHYATSLIGLAGLTALGWQTIQRHYPHRTSPGMAILILAFGVLLIPKLHKLYENHTRYTAALNPLTPFADWPSSTVRQSNYLLIAETIRRQAGTDATIATIAISGSMLGIIPLTGLRPSRPDLAHLSYLYLHSGNNPKAFKSKLSTCLPDFVLLTNSSPFRDTRTLETAINELQGYIPAGYIPKSATRHYGNFDGAIFRWSAGPRPCLKGSPQGDGA